MDRLTDAHLYGVGPRRRPGPDSAFVTANDQQPDATKVRVGLALVCVVVVVAVVLASVIDSTAGKAIMFAIAFTAVVRAYLLMRSLKRERAEAG